MRKFFMPSVRQSLLAVGLSVVLFVAAVSAVMFFQLPSVMGAERKLPIYCVDMKEKKIAISFDAAWGDEHTKAILDTLDKFNVKTTFFLVNFWAEKFPEDVKEIAARGHEVQNHSATHPDLSTLSKEQIEKELDVLADTVEKLVGKRPTLLRPPFGAYNNTVIQTAESMGYKVIQWSVDSLDWKSISAQQIIERVTRNVKPGSIVLFHNNAEHVEEYLPVILEKLQADGYEIVPISQLIYRDGYHMDHAGKQVYDGAKTNEQSGENEGTGESE